MLGRFVYSCFLYLRSGSETFCKAGGSESRVCAGSAAELPVDFTSPWAVAEKVLV